jgi:hypothetical protein
MVKINANEDCGNAPKKLLLKNFIVAVVKNDNTLVDRSLTDDVAWNTINGQHISGKKEVVTKLQQYRSDSAIELTINTIVTHGYDGVVSGLVKFKNRKAAAFCDIYRFRSSTNNAPIQMITTYSIMLD